jgi:hypothetical protein
MPESALTLTASGVVVGYQGFARDQVASVAKLSAGATRDPLDTGIYMTYATNALLTKVQVMAYMEDGARIMGDNLVPGVSVAYAGASSNYTNRIPTSKGDTVGILLGNTGSLLNQPVQELVTGSFTGVDLARTTTGSGYTIVFSKDDTTASIATSGTGAYSGSLFTFVYNKRGDLIGNKLLAANDESLVGYWDMETLSGTKLKDFSRYWHDLYCRGSISTIIDCKNRNFVEGKFRGKAIKMNLEGDNYADGTSKLNLTKDSNITIYIRIKFFDTTIWPLTPSYTGCAGAWAVGKSNGYIFWFPCESVGGDDNSIRMADALWFGVTMSYPGFKANTWYDLVGVHTPGAQKFYVDGVKIYEGTDYGWTSTGTLSEPLTILNGNSKFIADEVGIYNRWLSDNEISNIYIARK